MTEEKIIDIIYSRVSKEDETLQDLEIQEKKIIEKFNLKNPRILTERGSAYNMRKFHKRTEFIRIIKYAFSNDKTRILDIFMNEHKKKKIRLFVWDSHRLMRNVEYSLLFLLLSDLFEMDIYTFKDGKLKENKEETPSKKLLRYMILSIHAYSGEEYSYQTSQNIKKAFVNRNGISYSLPSAKNEFKAKKIGRKFTTGEGKKVDLEYRDVVSLNDKIRKLHKYYKSRGETSYYVKIVSKVKKDLNIVISKPYISRLKGY